MRFTVDRIDHIVVIYLENRSFDNLFGLFPGADGIAQAIESGARDAPARRLRASWN